MTYSVKHSTAATVNVACWQQFMMHQVKYKLLYSYLQPNTTAMSMKEIGQLQITVIT